jgi:hypothetical protein
MVELDAPEFDKLFYLERLYFLMNGQKFLVGTTLKEYV